MPFYYLKGMDFTLCLTWPAYPKGHTFAEMTIRRICDFFAVDAAFTTS